MDTPPPFDRIAELIVKRTREAKFASIQSTNHKIDHELVTLLWEHCELFVEQWVKTLEVLEDHAVYCRTLADLAEAVARKDWKQVARILHIHETALTPRQKARPVAPPLPKIDVRLLKDNPPTQFPFILVLPTDPTYEQEGKPDDELVPTCDMVLVRDAVDYQNIGMAYDSGRYIANPFSRAVPAIFPPEPYAV